ncbi:lipase 3-like [Sitodiplosis mosellana]|uniref:lipase 3-like n=1 Tax=Sitodiplosis mosellana TaxID=263140 RepID=UPI002443F496|nr:lipase 3-like [Sitodiplosis mosellana]
MVSLCFKTIFVSCLILALTQFGSVQPSVWSTIATRINRWASRMVDIVGHPYSRAVRIFQSPTTKALCKRNTDQLIEYYGYQSEVHNVTTKDGYILTVFRCNSKKEFSGKKKAVILQHGVLSSSDDFTVNIPSQALAYVFADNGYDVFLPNSRGTFYSKKHVSLSTSDSQFWNFSFYELAIYDYPAVIDYVRHETGNSKVFLVGHSQGTTTLMALLAELPEYNQYIAAASLMAPVGYLGNSGIILKASSRVSPMLKLFQYSEFLPRAGLSDITESFCSIDVTNFCGLIIDQIFGQSIDQRNDTMMISFLCKIPSGAATMQIIQFGQEVNYGFFGKYMDGSKIPDDFNLSRIDVPISLHYSPIDKFTNPKDVSRLISKLNHTLAFVQTVDSPQFNHIDFVWGKHAASIVYSKILEFFSKY